MALIPEMGTDEYVGAFQFRVSITEVAGDVNQTFTRVSGVVSSSEGMEFMHGTDPYVRKGRGRTTYEDITLERIYNGSDAFYKWRMDVEAGIVKRYDVKVEMLRPNGEVARAMICVGAWPIKWELPEMDASGSGGATERIILAVERVITE